MALVFTVKCPECKELFNASEDRLGSLVTCAACGHDFTFWKPEKDLPKYKDDLKSFRTAAIAQAGLPLSFKSPTFTKNQLKLLLSGEDCKRLFRFNHPMLCPVRNGCKIGNKICYRRAPVTVLGKEYLVCLTWRKYNRKRLIDWLRQMGVDYNQLYGGCKNLSCNTSEIDDTEEEEIEDISIEKEVQDEIILYPHASNATKRSVAQNAKPYHAESLIQTHSAEQAMFQKSFQQQVESLQNIPRESVVKKEPVYSAENKIGPVYSDTTIYIREFITALNKEIEYLKENGGQQYKITDGKFISFADGMWRYSFSFDGEAIIADDIPIRLTVNKETANGFVVSYDSRDANSLFLAVNKDFGEDVPSAELNVDPWKLLEALALQLGLFSASGFYLAHTLLSGRRFASKTYSSNIPSGQQIAKERATSAPITVIWGPPGTGKTHTISEIAIDFLKKNKRVLLVSQSNVSVDGMTQKIAQLMKQQGMEELFSQGVVLRYGHTRTEALSAHPYLTSMQFAATQNPEIKREIERLQKEIKTLSAFDSNSRSKSLAIMSLKEKCKKLQDDLKSAEDIFASEAKLLLTTISKSVISPILHRRKYDVVILDEASMAYVPQVVYAAMLAQSHFICVGDFKQLAPISRSPECFESLGQDIFSFLGINFKGIAYPHSWLVMLDTQRRMHPAISGIANSLFYEKRLCDYPDMSDARCDIVNRMPLSGSPLALIDLAGLYAASAKITGHSRYNILSALLSFAIAETAEQAGESNIGIITPYAAQSRLIRAMIKDYKTRGTVNISCATIHQFQGSESNLIVFDTVENYPLNKLGALTSKNENEALDRLVNVGITRARGKLVTLANKQYWKEHQHSRKNAFCSLIDHIVKQGTVISRKGNEFTRFISTLNAGRNFSFYFDADRAFDALREDMSLATNLIDVVLPHYNWTMDALEPLIVQILGASRAGVKIQIWTSDDSDYLPFRLKRFYAGVSKANQPMLIIDNELAWCGLPLKMNESYPEWSVRYNDVLPACISVCGHHTVATLKSLAEIKMSATAQEMDAMTRGKDSGLNEYVSSHFKCIKCRGDISVVWSTKGKPFVVCKKCKHKDFLTTSMVNGYITDEYVKCPRCRSRIYAGLSQYGLYIKCSQGHFLKPHEI